jgi:Sap, sulfolipid-1-addressing protein
MAVVAGLDPVRIGAVAYILARPRAMRLLVAYFIGGFGVSLIVGGVVVFVLAGADIGKSSSVPPEIEVAVGALALVVSVLVATGIAGRLRDRVQARRPRADDSDEPQTAERDRAGVEKLPGFEKLPQHVQDVLRSESPWIAWIAGVAVGMPSAYYLAAIAAILKSGVGTGGRIAGLLVFNVIAFAAAEIPLVSFAVAPEATRTRVDQLQGWVSTNQRIVIATLAGIVGVYLLIVGISKL